MENINVLSSRKIWLLDSLHILTHALWPIDYIYAYGQGLLLPQQHDTLPSQLRHGFLCARYMEHSIRILKTNQYIVQYRLWLGKGALKSIYIFLTFFDTGVCA